jgi:hypothetical protein
MAGEPAPGYRHTQTGPWAFVLTPIGILMMLLGWWLANVPGVPAHVPPVLLVAGGLLLWLAPCFHQLTVADEGDRLAIRFGPLPLFRKRIKYEDMRAVAIDRTTLLDGWGIHLSLRGGMVWNISGWDCVVIDHGGRTWVGTDDAANLYDFLKTRTAGNDKGTA